MSLKNNLLTNIVVVLTATLLISVSIYAFNYYYALTKNSNDFIREISENYTVYLSDYVKKQKKFATVLSEEVVVNNLIDAYYENNENHINIYKEEVNTMIKKYSDFQKYTNIFIVLENGLVIADSNDKLVGKYFDEDFIARDDFSKDIEEILAFKEELGSISAIIKHENETINKNKFGVINVLDVRFFETIMQNIKFGKTGYGYIMNENDYIIYHPEYNLDSIIELNNYGVLEKIKGKTSKANQQFEYEVNKEKVIAVKNRIIGLEWSLIVRQQVSDYMDNFIVFLKDMAIVILTTWLLAILYTSKFVSKLLKPINKLSENFGKTDNNGKYTYSEVKSKNELGVLSSKYDEMVCILNNKFEELETSNKENLYLLERDTITSLYNFQGMKNRYYEYIKNKKSFGILQIDFINFKSVNDNFSREVGDKILIDFAKRISKIENTICGRLTGDDFFIIIEGNDEDFKKVYEEVECIFEDKFYVGVLTFEFNCNMSFTVCNEKETFEEVLINLENTIGFSKQSTDKKIFIFDSTIKEKIKRRRQVKSALLGAIKNDELYLVFQPEQNLVTKKIDGFETLIRMENQQLGNISPVEFIPLAEESGEILAIGNWVMENAIKFIKKLIDNDFEFSFVSVNISAVQLLEEDFVGRVMALVKKYEIPPKKLQIELTESLLVSDLDRSIAKLNVLRMLGVTVALDDFGTRYSSFSYIVNLPIDVLKIDRSFITDIHLDKKKQAVVKSLLDLCKELGFKTVGEGIEVIEEQEIVKKFGCTLLQGYYFSKPLKMDEAINILKNTNL